MSLPLSLALSDPSLGSPSRPAAAGYISARHVNSHVTTAPERVGPDGVRPATRADLLDVFRIERASFEQPWPFSAFEDHLEAPGFLVAEPGAQPSDSTAGAADANASAPAVVGYVVADVVPAHGGSLGHVKDLAVAPPRRGEGIGRTLLARGLAAVSAAGARSAKLEVRPSNDTAIGLYRDAGFEHLRTVSRYYADGEDALVMVTHL